MSMKQAVTALFTKSEDYSSNTGRKEYWLGVLFYVIVTLTASTIDMVSFLSFQNTPILWIIALGFLLLPFLAATARRLNDAGHSRWWMLLLLLNLVGYVILAILLCGKTKQTLATRNAT